MRRNSLNFGEKNPANNLLGLLLTSENISLHSIFYNFLLVEGDPDDNRFADAYLSSGADVSVTNDSKLISLKDLDFPPMNTMKLQELEGHFKELL